MGTNRNNYQQDRAWSDRFIPAMRNIIGPLLVIPSTFEQDVSEASDLVVLKANSVTIACRVRRPGFVEKYGGQFTIRCERSSGASTELEKLVNGWGDWMFYGHSNAAQDGFEVWNLLDLSAWRAHLIRDKGKIRRGVMDNKDGTKFAWFDIASFIGEPNLVLVFSGKENAARLL